MFIFKMFSKNKATISNVMLDDISIKNKITNLLEENGSEEEIINLIKKTADSKKFIANFCYRKDDNSMSLLIFSAINNYFKLAQFLIENGINIEATLSGNISKSNNLTKLDDTTALGVACYFGNVKIVKLLLENGANYLHKVMLSPTTLMCAKTPEICQMLIDKARAENKLEQFVSLTNYAKFDAFAWHCHYHHADVIEVLSKIENFHKWVDVNNILNYARVASWEDQTNSKIYDNLCKQLRPFHIKEVNEYISNANNGYFSLFKAAPSHSDDRNKQKEAIKVIIAKLYELFLAPDKCIKYFQCLNEQLQDYYQYKHNVKFPELDKTNYEFRSINSLEFPIPTQSYNGIKKESSLQELLILIFRQYDKELNDKELAQHAYKWVGFIPNFYADQIVENGDFITENRVEGGLFHGKLSHVLQQLILINVIQDGTIPNPSNVSIRDILKGFVSLRGHDGSTLWAEVRDKRNFNEMTFNDPFGLHSFIMQNKTLFPHLADYLIDSFCKGFQAYKSYTQECTSFKELSTDDFIDQLNDIRLHHFFTVPKIFKTIVNLEKNSKNIAPNNSGEGYAIVTKEYHPNESFKLKSPMY